MPIVSREFIMSGQSAAGGWNRKQMQLLGIVWPPRSGWIDAVVGTQISNTDAATFAALRGKRLKAKTRNKTAQRSTNAQYLALINTIGAVANVIEGNKGAALDRLQRAADLLAEAYEGVTRPEPVETQSAAE